MSYAYVIHLALIFWVSTELHTSGNKREPSYFTSSLHGSWSHIFQPLYTHTCFMYVITLPGPLIDGIEHMLMRIACLVWLTYVCWTYRVVVSVTRKQGRLGRQWTLSHWGIPETGQVQSWLCPPERSWPNPLGESLHVHKTCLTAFARVHMCSCLFGHPPPARLRFRSAKHVII